jgi:F-type H+-transporting ATPase subunit delta
MAVAQRIYARALFEAAQDEGRLEEVRRDFDALVDALRGSSELEQFLANPQVEPAAKADVLARVAEGADELVRNALRVIAEKGRSGELAEIHEELTALVDQAQGRIAVELTTAYELPDDEAAAIVGRIEQATGRSVEASRKVDPSLIGGLILQAGSLRVDASVRGRLSGLRRELATKR